MATNKARPKIGYLTGEYPRATDTFIQREVAALRSDDYDVTTFAVRRPGPEHMVGPQQREGAANTTYLLELARSSSLPISHLRLLMKGPKRYLSALRLAWDTRRSGLKGTAYQLFYFLEAGLLARELDRRDIDHLHNHFGDASCTVAMLASELGGKPFSLTLHGPGIFFEAHTWRLDEKVKRAAFCACISYFARSQAAIFGGSEVTDRLHIIHCGVDPQVLPLVEHSGKASRLIFVGRVVELKGMSVLLDAMDQLSDTHPDLHLTVVGDGPDKKRFEAACKRSKLADNVEFVGSKSQAEVAELLAQSDVFVLPSFAEGVPVVLMEAMASGLPVVTTAVGGISELVEDEVNGFLIRPSDPEQLADRIGRLLDDPGLRTGLGRAGRAKVESDFSSSDEAARLGGLMTNSAAGLASAVRPALES